ncbi:HAD-IA family hydrolase [Alkalimarinus alittae]|uniref:HAD-IA family hydrolase n=1 Tax=Alkalimarinus alittae TaxID=2961619 RepID=A0ABY6MYJ6_9ALTE|nr:HAD-IA family hydrolase [Alkalimarinus alittae]UZE94916.1 HAD-IA family hydrolase [Alkalimarinus alittae]
MLTFIPEAVLFDLDGTLLDTAPDFIRVVNLQRQRHNLPPLASHLIRETVSNGARALIKLAFDLDDNDDAFTVRHAELLAMYEASIAEETVFFPGIDLFLKELEAKSIPWGIVTNKPSRFTHPLLERLTLNNRCSVTVCPDDVSQTKPHPEPLFLACKKLNCSPERTLYVGDHVRDINAGRSAGMITIAARYGYIDTPERVDEWKADLIIDHGNELTEWLNAVS